MDSRVNILSLNTSQLLEQLVGLGWEKYRAKQVEDWLWNKGVRHFEEMTNISKNYRNQLNEHFVIHGINQDKIQTSRDGTVKFRFRLHDGLKIESVLIPVDDDSRYTVCVSSQAGCSLTCSFCATGKMGLLRQLNASEIFDQYVEVNKKCEELYGSSVTNIVYMGMGEPLLNYKQVVESIQRLTNPDTLNISARRITLSTAGIAKMIKKLADDGLKVNLALSLHAADDEKRNTIMPINESNRLSILMDALQYYYKHTGNKISYEYISFEHFNDNPGDAKNLIKLCSKFPVRVNIIEYNPVQGVEYEKSSDERINQFAQIIRKSGVMITVRKSRGKDIDAACGQLANQDI